MVLTDNIFGYWKLDETTGSAIDSVGNNNGEVINVTQGAAGKIGNSYNFTSATDVVDFGNVLNLEGSQNFTISLWANATSVGAQQGLVDMYDVKAGEDKEMAFYLYNDTINILREAGVTTNWDTGYLLPSGEWVHLAFTYDGSNRRLYVNGSTYGDPFADTDNIGSPLYVSLTFGAFPSGTGYAEGFDGRIDEVGIWLRSLTNTEISAIYNEGNGLTYPFTSGALSITRIGGVFLQSR